MVTGTCERICSSLASSFCTDSSSTSSFSTVVSALLVFAELLSSSSFAVESASTSFAAEKGSDWTSFSSFGVSSNGSPSWRLASARARSAASIAGRLSCLSVLGGGWSLLEGIRPLEDAHAFIFSGGGGLMRGTLRFALASALLLTPDCLPAKRLLTSWSAARRGGGGGGTEDATIDEAPSSSAERVRDGSG